MGAVGIRSSKGVRTVRYNDPSLIATQRDFDLVLPKFDVTGGIDSCYPYRGAIDRNGYGKVKINGIWPPNKGACRQLSSHQFIYLISHPELFWRIPPGLTIDHLCHNTAAKSGDCIGGSTCPHRRCGNIEHLELVTTQLNTSRGLSGEWQRVKTRCTKCNEKYDELNTYKYVDKLGRTQRRCKNCARVSKIRSRKKLSSLAIARERG